MRQGRRRPGKRRRPNNSTAPRPAPAPIPAVPGEGTTTEGKTMSDEPDMSMRANFTSSDGDEVTLRQPILGMGPSILITPSVEDDGVVFEVEACDFPPDACAEVLEMLAAAIQNRSEEPS